MKQDEALEIVNKLQYELLENILIFFLVFMIWMKTSFGK